MKRAAIALTLALSGSITLLAGCHKPSDQAAQGGGHHKGGGPGSIPVQVASVQSGTLASTIPVTGSIQALQDVQLSARAAGRVIEVTAREGQAVRKGQLIVRQDTTDLEANVRQAQATIQSNVAKVSQARTNYQIGIIQAQQAVLLARAQVAAARQNYLKLKRGSRPQQVLTAQNQVALAKANLDNAATILHRNQTLFSQGAIAKADVDTAQTNYAVYNQQYRSAQQSLSLTVEGSQREDIAAAAAQVQQQETTLRNAEANRQQVALRRDDIIAAQAAVAQAKDTLAFNQQQVSNGYIRSPIDGIVAARTTEPGQIASPGTALMRIVNVQTVYYEPTVSATDFTQIAPGQSVTIHVDALPGRQFSGKVQGVFPAASATNRVFSLRVTVANPRSELRPGMFARGALLTQVHRNVTLVPVAALMPVQTDTGDVQSSSGTATGATTLPPQQVFVVGPGSKAVARPVTLGIVTATQAEVVSGVRPGDSLIVTGQGQVHPGDLVKVERAPQAGGQVAAL